jgi:single-strand DNA-binding protein
MVGKSINHVTLVGRLGKDPEIRRTNNGGTVATFTVATDDPYKDKNGEWQNRTDWHNVTLFGKLAEVVQQYCTKGMLVVVEGKLKTESWDDRDGNKKYRTFVKAHNVVFGDSKGSRQEQSKGNDQQQSGGGPFDGKEDDLPF